MEGEMMNELTGWDLNWSSIEATATEGAEIAISGETNSSRGFSDKEWECSGTITDMGDYSLQIDGDGDHDYRIEKGGISITLYRILENTGDYPMHEIEEIHISDGDADE